MEDALEEMASVLQPTKIVRAAIENGVVWGWVGANNEVYEASAWELHPLIVHPNYQGLGIGRALVADLEIEVKKRGGNTIF